MATRADDLKDPRTDRAEPGTKTPPRPPRPVPVRSVSDVIKRSVAKHPRVLELLAKR